MQFQERVLRWMKFTLKGIKTRPFVVEIGELKAVLGFPLLFISISESSHSQEQLGNFAVDFIKGFSVIKPTLLGIKLTPDKKYSCSNDFLFELDICVLVYIYLILEKGFH